MAAIYDGSPLFGVQPNAFSKFQSASLTPIGSAKEEDYYAYLNDIFSTHWPDVLTREKDEYRSDGLEAFTWQHRPPVPRNKWTYNVGTSYSILAGDFDLVKKKVQIPQSSQQQFITSDPENGDFPVLLGQLLAKQCDLVYKSLPLAKASLYANPFFSNEAVFSKNDAEGLGFMFENHAFLVFRGSSSFTDWYRNFKFTKEEDGDVRIHKGFRINLNLLQKQIDDWLATIPKDCKGYICSGHSLGGAMATLCAYRLAAKGLNVSRVITFGAPRVGDFKFQKIYKELGLQDKTVRVVNGTDAVSYIPPEFLGYSHVGTSFFLPTERILAGTPVAGDKPDWWTALTFYFLPAGHWYYLLKALPTIFGFFHSSAEHQRSKGYSNAMAQYIEAKADEHVADKEKMEKLSRLHQMYFSGEVK